jgi:hypothetical protein
MDLAAFERGVPEAYIAIRPVKSSAIGYFWCTIGKFIFTRRRAKAPSQPNQENTEGHVTHIPRDKKFWKSHTHLATPCGILLLLFRVLDFAWFLL